MLAQVQTQTTTSEGQSQMHSKIERGEVVSVNGNDLIVKTEDGQIHHFADIPDTVKVNVNGQELSVHELKPGMKLERTITTTTVPRTVTTVKKVSGKIWQVSPPDSVILTMENGENQQFKIPKDQKFNVDGQELDAFGLKKGMRISATKIVEVPESVISQKKSLYGKMPPPPATPIVGPILVVQPAAPAEVAAEKPPEKLPQTASKLPAIGLLGVFSLLAGIGLRRARLRTE
jgi:hypothetical protein